MQDDPKPIDDSSPRSDNSSADTDSPPQVSPSFKLPIKEPKGKRKIAALVALVAISLFAIAGFIAYMFLSFKTPAYNTDTEAGDLSSLEEKMQEPEVSGLQLDPNKNYGDKYADGILPVGDDKYVTDSPKKGYIYACSSYASSFKTDNIGADSRGPWFVNDNKEYNLNKKISVQGTKNWKGEFNNTVSDSERTITTNGLPLAHATGNFPVSTSDPAYSYDKNPNTISSQSLTYKLDAMPDYGDPKCMSGEAGIMLTGVSLFNGFDAGARDAGAWEVQDACEGHPQKTGHYHYHTLSSCIKDIGVGTIIGFALDGFPITGPKVGNNNFLTTDNLDECHGIVSEVTLDGQKKTMYHYVMTLDFPYSVSCFRGEIGESPGTNENQQANGQSVGIKPNNQSLPPSDTGDGQDGPPDVPPPPKP